VKTSRTSGPNREREELRLDCLEMCTRAKTGMCTSTRNKMRNLFKDLLYPVGFRHATFIEYVNVATYYSVDVLLCFVKHFE